MPISFNRVDGPEDTAWTVTTSKGTAAVVITNPNPELISKDLIAANSNLNFRMADLLSSVKIFEDTVHPKLLDAKIFEEVVKSIAPAINLEIELGRTETRGHNKAYDRATEPAETVNEQMRQVYQSRLVSMDAPAIMQMINKPKSSIELLLAALDVAEVVGLSEDFVRDLRERLILHNAASIIASDAAAEPSVDRPFATGIDQKKASNMAQNMLNAHLARGEALDALEASVSRLVVMLAVLCGSAAGVDEVWQAIRQAK